MIVRVSNRWKGQLLSPKYAYCYSTGAAASQPNLLANCLINSLGFDKEEALAAAKKGRSPIKSFRNDPNLVINFLQELGLDKPQIKSIVSYYPRVLSADVGKTLQPKIKVLQDIPLSRLDIIKVLTGLKCFLTLSLRSKILPPIEYLRNLFGSNELVAKAFLGYSTLLHWSIPQKIHPNVVFLKEMGISEKNLARIMFRSPEMLLREPPYLEKVAEIVENEYKMPRDSQMIYHGITAIGETNQATIDKKFNIFRSFGWSEENIRIMFRANPFIVSFSDVRLKKVVDFFMTEVGCEIDYLARHPLLFNFSLEERVKPRLKIRKILLEKGLISAKLGLYYILSISKPRFLKRFVLPYKDENSLSLTDIEFLMNYISSHNYEMTSLHALYVKSIGRKKKLCKT